MTSRQADDKRLPIREFAFRQTGILLRRFAFEARRAPRLATPEAIHDLRVAARRFSQCLRVFRGFLPDGAVKKIRRRLKKVLARAAEVRNRDVALEWFAKAGLAPESPFVDALVRDRELTRRQLMADLRRWSRRHSFRRWRAQLGA